MPDLRMVLLTLQRVNFNLPSLETSSQACKEVIADSRSYKVPININHFTESKRCFFPGHQQATTPNTSISHPPARVPVTMRRVMHADKMSRLEI